MAYLINQRSVVDAIATISAFCASSMRGQKTKVDGKVIYEVFSYEEPIGRLEFDLSKSPSRPTLMWITPQKFSVTTSKHTSKVREAFSLLTLYKEDHSI